MAPTSIIEDDWNSTVFDLSAEDTNEVVNSFWYIVGKWIAVDFFSEWCLQVMVT